MQQATGGYHRPRVEIGLEEKARHLCELFDVSPGTASLQILTTARQKISALGSLADIDRELLLLELDLAVKRGMIERDDPAQEKIRTMQRKANLGMNAVLSVSLALGRLVAAREGKELPDLLQETEGTIDRDRVYGFK